MRAEKVTTAVLVTFVLGLFTVLSFLYNGKGFGIFAEATPEPTVEPIMAAADELRSRFNGSLTVGDGICLVSFVSAVDSRQVSVRVFEVDGIVCMELVRETDDKLFGPVPTSMFEPVGTETEDPRRSERLSDYAGEIADCVSVLDNSGDVNELRAKLEAALLLTINEDASGTSVISGVYSVNIGFEADTGLLTARCGHV